MTKWQKMKYINALYRMNESLDEDGPPGEGNY